MNLQIKIFLNVDSLYAFPSGSCNRYCKSSDCIHSVFLIHSHSFDGFWKVSNVRISYRIENTYILSYVRDEYVSSIAFWISTCKNSNCTAAFHCLNICAADVLLMQRSVWKCYHIPCIFWYCAFFSRAFVDVLFAFLCRCIDYIGIVARYLHIHFVSACIVNLYECIVFYRVYIDRWDKCCIIHKFLACKVLQVWMRCDTCHSRVESLLFYQLRSTSHESDRW